MHPEINNR